MFEILARELALKQRRDARAFALLVESIEIGATQLRRQRRRVERPRDGRKERIEID